MTTFEDLIGERRPVDGHGPWPRYVVDADTWRATTNLLRDGDRTLLGLWGETGWVHMATLNQDLTEMAVLSLDCPVGSYPSVGAVHPPAIRLERTISDLWGLQANGALDQRPWLDHGRWRVRLPLGWTAAASGPTPYAFLPAEGESLHQIAVGPVHAGTIEPG